MRGLSRQWSAPARALIVAFGCLVALGGLPSGVAASSTSFIQLGFNTGAAVFDPTGALVYAGSGDDGSVAVIDRATHAVIGRVPIPNATPTAIVIDPATGNALVGGTAGVIQVLDGPHLTLGSPIPLPISNALIYHLAVGATGRAYAFVQVPSPNHQPPTRHLIAFNLDGSGPVADVQMAGFALINDLIVDDAAGRVYGATRDGVSAYNPTTLGTLATIPITGGSYDIAFDPIRHRLYSVGGDSTTPAAVIDTDSLTIAGTIAGTGDVFGVGVDPARDRVLIERRPGLQVIEGGTLTAMIPPRGQLVSPSVDPTTGDVWLNGLFAGAGGLFVIDLAPTATPRSGFVTRVGTDLTLDGAPYRFTGVNIYNANSDGWCREAIDDATLDSSLDSIGQSWTGHGVIRAWFFQTLATSEPSGARDWTRFDRLLKMAADRGYKVIPTLADQWGECGARVAPTYSFKTEAWYTGGYAAPDPALAAAHGGTWLSYRDWVAEVVARYKDDPTVAFWQLMNEAEVNPGGAFGACPPGDGPRDELIDFAQDVSGLVKSIDPDHLLSLGTIGSGQCGTSGPQYKDVHALPGIDLCEFHDYTPNQAIPGDQWNGLGVRVQQCAELGKPLFVGEAGIRPVDTGGTFEDRERAFSVKIHAQLAHGIDGVVAWNYWPGGSTLDNYDIGPGDPAIRALEPINAFDTPVVNAVDDVDDGSCNVSHCSLREAIKASNNRGGTVPHAIEFAIPGPGPHVIRPITPLPPITHSVILDGTSQSDYAGYPTVVISGVDGPISDGLVLDAPDSAVRGLVINGFAKAAINLENSPSSMVTGNWIGTDATGTVAVRHPSGRADVGVLVLSNDQQIGGVTGGDPNTIAGTDVGILIRSGATGSRIIGNRIGTDATGGAGAGTTTNGIRLDESASGIRIGGTGGGEGNVITGSGADGIAIVSDSATGNVISGNSIHDNGGLGIDLGDDGVDPTPPAIVNPSTGPNHFQARPTIDAVNGNDVSGRVWGVAGPIHLEFFVSPACDPSGNGEGERFIGATDVTASGLPPFATFAFTSPTTLAPTDVITATATSTDGTSELSRCWPSPAGPGDTPVGTDVVAAPVDATTGESPVQVAFDTVTAPGVTALSTSASAPALPAGFVVGDPPTYFDISTTATFAGGVEVCIDYAGISFIDPSALRLYHFDSGLGTWVDATTSVDTVAHQVCGTVTSLSPFAIVQRAPTFTTAATATFTAGTTGSFAIRTTGFLHPALSVTGSLPGGIALVDRHDGTAVLSGKPASGSGGVYPITLVGMEAGVRATQAFTLTVREAPAFTSPTSSTFTLGVAGTFQVTTRGYPVPTLTRAGSLPGGLTFNTATGVLSGTPAAGTTGTLTITLKATNGIGTAAQQTLTISVTKRSTSATAACSPDPNVPGNATTCTATIADASPGTKSAPTAAVAWSVVTGSGKLAGASCKTVALTRVCTVTYTPAVTQTVDQRLRVSYPGDASHGTSTVDIVSRSVVTSVDAYATPLNLGLSVVAPGVMANDRNVAGGSATLLAGPLHGGLTLRSDGSFTYTPTRGYRGKDGFAYRVKLGSVWSLPTLVTIAVGP